MSDAPRGNLGTRRIVPLRHARFPDADAIVHGQSMGRTDARKVDVLLVNPPAPSF